MILENPLVNPWVGVAIQFQQALKYGQFQQKETRSRDKACLVSLTNMFDQEAREIMRMLGLAPLASVGGGSHFIFQGQRNDRRKD